MSASEECPQIAPYSRANLQALITKLSLGEITDEEFHDGMHDIILSWKAQFTQPECPWGWHPEALSAPHTTQSKN